MHIQRNIEPLINKLLNYYPAVVIIGSRQCGKTELVKHLRPDWEYFDLEKEQDFNLINNDITIFFEENQQHLIFDEAQIYPKLFQELRSVIDNNRKINNRFLITGSSSPELITNVSESLAGRVAVVELNTLKANELFQKPLSNFYDIFKNPLTTNIKMLEPSIKTQDMRHHWLKGGYPEPVLSQDDFFHTRWMQDYKSTYINRDIANLFPKLNKQSYQRFLSTLGHLSGTIINKSELARSIEVSESSISDYLKIAEATFLWRNINYYNKNTLKSLVKRPKGHLRDSGLLNYLLNIRDLEQLLTLPNVGNLFEAFVIEELLAGIEATGISGLDINFIRSYGGSEVDLILEGGFGTLPIEIKMASSIQTKHLTHLNKFIDDKKLPFGIIINQSERMCFVNKKVIQVPIGCL